MISQGTCVVQETEGLQTEFQAYVIAEQLSV